MVLPGTNKNFDQFRFDDGECRQYASYQVGGATAEDASVDSGVRSAAVGTVVGAAAGAHKKRKGEKQQQAAEQQAEKQQAANVEGYQRAFGACMEGKGYTVK